MLKPYCPYGCAAVINTPGLRLNESTDITRGGIKVIVCPSCYKQIRVTTKLIPDYTCEKIGWKSTVLEKLKKWLSLIMDWFGRPSRYS